MHKPVLVDEVVESLNLRPGGVYLDGTVGYGGHAEAILTRLNGQATYIGLDRDQDAINSTSQRFKSFKNVFLRQASYEDSPQVLAEIGISGVDGILLDLGVSSPQLDQAERGFSFKADGPLDMRFDIRSSKSAADIVNLYPPRDLVRIIKEYGEERFTQKIVGAIEKRRKEKPFHSTRELAETIEQAIPRRFWPKQIHPATRTFQALRIEANDELGHLERALPKLVHLLKKGGRISIITFHSLEDRIVKRFFKEAQKSCICPPDFPVCRCDKEQLLKVVTKKDIKPTKIKIKDNVRARSAKLRTAERV